MKIAYCVFALILTAAFAAKGQGPISFKPGAYRGTIFVTTSVEGVGDTTATLKVRGQSIDDNAIRLIGIPQLAQPIIGGDNFPVRLFRVTEAFFTEYPNTDTPGPDYLMPWSSFSVKGNTVKAEGSFPRPFGTFTVMVKIKVQLTRVGN